MQKLMEAPKPRVRPLSRNLATILDFEVSAVLQGMSKCPFGARLVFEVEKCNQDKCCIDKWRQDKCCMEEC